MKRAVIFGLFFTSGFTGLIYEVLWMKELGLLFGNTAHAAAATLAAFFLGLAAGAYVWGRRSERLHRPLRVYALLEAGVALSALLYFVILDVYHVLYTPLFTLVAANPYLFLLAKLLLALILLFPPAFFMGGTLPVMSQYLIQHRDTFGRTTSILYAVNTGGATLGAFIAGFYLPPLLGFSRAYLATVALTGIVAIIAWWGGNRAAVSASPGLPPSPLADKPKPPHRLTSGSLHSLAFFSGFVTLSLEVLWTRMFSQVLQNSVYTYTLILVTFLLSLALGALLARGLMRLRLSATGVLSALLVLAALLIALSPFGFSWLTEGLRYIDRQENWEAYIGRVFWSAGLVMGTPGIVLGSILPFLLYLNEPYMVSSGQTVGNLISVNTAGAILGSLWAGFVGLEWLGLWPSIRFVAVIYLALPLLFIAPHETSPWLSRLAPIGVLVLMFSSLDISRLPQVHVQAPMRQESLYQVWEGSSATVAVVKQDQSLKLKVNNYYTLGGSESIPHEARQAHLPLMIHPRPQSVFFLGLGTGITAGASLTHDIDRVVVCELIPEVVEAAQLYFKPYVHGLFEDDRVKIIVADGRSYLSGTTEQYDVIIADLFLPWRAGVGSLYTREHFQSAQSRLRQGGLFAQWLPLYQISRDEFDIIVHTMLQVFPQVTLWRGDFFAKRPIVALVGHSESSPFEPHPLSHPEAVPFMAHYVGNLTMARHLFETAELNTDDRPVIEYRTPITHRRQRADVATWFVGLELMSFMQSLLELTPPDQDVYLQKMSQREKQMVRAGLSLHRARILKQANDILTAEEELRRYKQAVESN